MFKLGLINCDPLTPEVIDVYGDYPAFFAELFASVTDQISWHVFDAFAEELPKSTTDFDAMLITGSRFGVNDDDKWIQPLIAYIKTLWHEKIKTVGICFGHQAMAQAMGGLVDKAPSGWKMGVVTTDIIEHRAWMQPKLEQFNVCVSHQDQVLTLPPQGQCLANTPSCPFAMIQYSNLFLSIQGHPEFNQAYTRFLINKRKSLFDPVIYQDFIQSLSIQRDSEVLASWMLNFISAP